jgi:hypothetical protein
VVAIRPFQRVLPAAGVHGIGLDVAFEHDLGMGRHLQRHAEGGRHLGARAAQQAGKLVFGQVSGTGVTAPRMVAGSAPMATATG